MQNQYRFIVFLFFFLPFIVSAKKGQNIYYFPQSKECELNKMDQTPFLIDLLNEIDKKKGGKIIFKKGIYHFYPDRAAGFYHEITNHDNGFYRFAFSICNFNRLEIDGQGSEFIFHGQMIPFLIQQSSNIVLANFTIDWELPHFLQGKIIANNQTNNTIDIEIPGEFKVKQQGNRLTFGAEGWEHAFCGDNIVFDSAKRSPIYFTELYAIPYSENKNIFSEQFSPTVFRLKANFKKLVPPINSIIVFKGPSKFNRTSPAIHLKASKNVSLKNITIHHAGGMGVIAEKTEDIQLDSVNVVLRKGTERMITTTADATHFCNCKGSVVIENCIFENMLDDAINVHGTYLRVEKIVDSKTIYASVSHFHQYGYDFAGKGDTVQFVNDSTILPLAKNIVSKIEKINNQYYRISFQSAVPEKLKPNDGIENVSWYPATIIRNNIVRNNRARGFLISSGKPVLIERNKITSQMSAILFEGDLNYWFESGAVSHVIIRDNLFTDCSYSGNKHPVIFINPMMKKHTEKKYEKDIRIENNRFLTFDSYIFDAKSVDGLIFKDNVIEKTQTYLPIWNSMPMINISHSSHVEIKNNTSPNYPDITISVDEISKSATNLLQKQ